ncbi:MAG: hypothetical protein WBG19_05290 [Thermoplasmata archaeon]
MERKGRLMLLALVVCVVAATAIVMAVLFTVPLGSKSFSGQVSSAGPASSGACGSSCYFGYVTENLPSGVTVSVSWQDTSGTFVYFDVFSESNPTGAGCVQSGTSGSCSFASNGGTYTFALSDEASSGTTIVTFSVSYPVPYL